MAQRVRLNIDLGELPDEPEALYALTDLANLACGGHVGDAASMRAALALCARHGVTPIVHPSFVDREGFGRRALDVAPATLAEQVAAQCAALAHEAAALGLAVRGLKAHGALYHACDRDAALADAVLAGAHAALGDGLVVLGPAGGALAAAVAARGDTLLIEGFADRARERGADGRWQLVPRARPGAVLADPAAAAELARTLIAEGEIGTLCVHGDGPAALAVAHAVRAVLGPRSGA